MPRSLTKQWRRTWPAHELASETALEELFQTLEGLGQHRFRFREVFVQHQIDTLSLLQSATYTQFRTVLRPIDN